MIQNHHRMWLRAILKNGGCQRFAFQIPDERLSILSDSDIRRHFLPFLCCKYRMAHLVHHTLNRNETSTDRMWNLLESHWWIAATKHHFNSIQNQWMKAWFWLTNTRDYQIEDAHFVGYVQFIGQKWHIMTLFSKIEFVILKLRVAIFISFSWKIAVFLSDRLELVTSIYIAKKYEWLLKTFTFTRMQILHPRQGPKPDLHRATECHKKPYQLTYDR